MSFLFGYVRPCKEELKVKEYNMFRAVYCGLCKTLGQSANQLCRFGLSYDFTFLALLLIALDEEEPRLAQESCLANPFRKKAVVKRNRHLEYAADMSNIFTYLKLVDDWQDEHSIRALLTMPVFYLPVKAGRRRYEDKYNFFRELLQELTALEASQNNLLDKSADLFARIMTGIFTPDYIEGEREKRVLRFLGYNLGRLIYILDAYSDLEEDLDNSNYNPLILQYEYRKGEGLESFKKRIQEPVEFTLTYTLSNLAKGYELLELHRYKEILDNIIYMGLYRVMRNKLEGSDGKGERSLQNTGTE